MISYSKILIILLFCNLTSCVNKKDKIPDNKSVAFRATRDTFYIDSHAKPLLTVRALINKKDTAVLVIDNSTANDYTLILNEPYARRKGYILNDTTNRGKYIRSINKFMDSATLLLNVGNYQIASVENRVMKLPSSKRIIYDGILGYGFLKDKMIEINYKDKYFIIDSSLTIDTSAFSGIELRRNFSYSLLPISFYMKSKAYQKICLLDLGDGLEGIYWGGAAARSIQGIHHDVAKQKSFTGNVTGETDTTFPALFDSVVFSDPHNVLKNVPSQLSVSGRGISGSNLILVGNDVLSRFEKIYLDFRSNKLFLPNDHH